MGAKIAGVGKALPEKRLTNFDLEKIVATSDEWITQRVGIKERRIAADNEYSSTFSIRAAQDALKAANLPASEIDFILVATSTPDMIFPNTACLVQRAIGADRAAVLDIYCACSGFIYGSSIAWSMIASGAMKHVLVIGVEINSRILNWKDRGSCILFGDGAGAAVFSPCPAGEGVLTFEIGGDGNYGDLLKLVNSGCVKHPEYDGTYITMQGNEVFKQAVRTMNECALEVLEKAGLDPADVDLLIPHQANIRIIDAVAKRLELPPEKVFVNIEKYGNTTAGTIPIALCEALEENRIKKGDIILMDAFGAGLTWGALLMRWA
ncbi:MAG: ketoacyl-ACP synthase III [Kiritimatiellae bacterium]|nr:ketoacyl-ACP synthase III [Kiritimatiellia bacterium]